jgi:hypothetical protein
VQPILNWLNFTLEKKKIIQILLTYIVKVLQIHLLKIRFTLHYLTFRLLSLHIGNSVTRFVL